MGTFKTLRWSDNSPRPSTSLKTKENNDYGTKSQITIV